MAEQGGKKINRAKARLQRRAEAMEQQRVEARAESANMPDLKAIEATALSTKIQSQQLVEHDIQADGHCLYSAFSDQLQIRCEIAVDFKSLRQQIARFMRDHPDEFEPFLQAESDAPPSIDQYTKEIEETARWGGEMEILALARRYNVSIKIVQAEGEDLTYEEAHSTQLTLARYRHMYSLGAHFNSLRPTTERGSN